MRKTPISDQKAYELFREYRDTRSKADEELAEIVYKNEQYFDDMCFELGSIVHDFVSCQLQDEDGEVYETSSDKFMDLRSQKWRFYVKKLREKNTMGVTYLNERKIIINVPYKDDLKTILHEMIHAHETLINQMPSFYHDILVFSLYKSLSAKIPDLYDRIVRHTHEHFGMEITFQGGEHDMLFFLKSLDLDLKLGYELEAICGYGRDEYSDAED